MFWHPLTKQGQYFELMQNKHVNKSTCTYPARSVFTDMMKVQWSILRQKKFNVSNWCIIKKLGPQKAWYSNSLNSLKYDYYFLVPKYHSIHDSILLGKYITITCNEFGLLVLDYRVLDYQDLDYPWICNTGINKIFRLCIMSLYFWCYELELQVNS